MLSIRWVRFGTSVFLLLLVSAMLLYAGALAQQANLDELLRLLYEFAGAT